MPFDPSAISDSLSHWQSSLRSNQGWGSAGWKPMDRHDYSLSACRNFSPSAELGLIYRCGRYYPTWSHNLTSTIAFAHPLLPAQIPNAALPNDGPHSHPPAATANVLIPSTIMGSNPLICAPHESTSCCAITGTITKMAPAAVTTEAARLIWRRLRRRSKNLSHVKTPSLVLWEGLGDGFGEAAEDEVFRAGLLSTRGAAKASGAR